MSTPKFTPWRAHPRYTTRSPRVEQVDILDANGFRVASVLADDTEEVENGTILEVVSKSGQERAEFIVRAVNSHDALVELLGRALSASDDGDLDGWRIRARAALEKTKVKPKPTQGEG